MKRTSHDGRTLAKRRRMCGATQHDISREADIPINRLVFAETGRLSLEPDELERVRHVLRKRAQRAMDAVSA